MNADKSPVVSDPEILGGTLVFRGTRVMAQTLLDYVAAGDSLEVFLKQFPSVKKAQAEQFYLMACEKSAA